MELQPVVEVTDGVSQLLTTGTPGEPGPQVCQGGEDDGHQDGGDHQEAVVISHWGKGHAMTQEDGN